MRSPSHPCAAVQQATRTTMESTPPPPPAPDSVLLAFDRLARAKSRRPEMSRYAYPVVIALLAALLAGLAYLLVNEDRELQRDALSRDIDTLVQSISLRLETMSEAATKMSLNIPGQDYNERRFTSAAREQMLQKQELMHMAFIDSQRRVRWSVASPGPLGDAVRPPESQIGGDEVGAAIEHAQRSHSAFFSPPYEDISGPAGADNGTGTLDMAVVDDFQTVSDKDAFRMARRLTREEGLFVGGSSGLIAHVALRVARQVNDPNAFVVTILCDTGERYLSKLYSDEWMRENQLLDSPRVTLRHVVGSKESDGGAPAVVSVSPGGTVRQALGLMSLHDVSQLPVMDGPNCVGSVSDWSLSQKSLENPKLLDATVSEVMDSPFPVVAGDLPVDSVVKLLSKSNPAVLVRENGEVRGIVTRSDMLRFMMSR